MRILALLAIIISSSVLSDEVPNGAWTGGFQKISEVQSFWSYTYFRISDASSCGTENDHLWRIQNDHSSESLKAAHEYKKSMLLAAFIAQKDIKLRCENGYITDFIIRN